MSEWSEWESDEIIDLYAIINAAYDAKKEELSLIEEISELSKLRKILKALGLHKLQALQIKLTNILVLRDATKDDVESQDKT